ncbi:MAG: ABC transporter ATP-binding protein [Planctomycetota bacterium]
MPELIVENVTKEYPTRAAPLKVLRGVSIALRGGESLAVVGPSGSGKSTLLSIIGTLESPTSGRVAIDGENAANLSPKGLARFRNRRVGLVFQDHCLLPQCSAMENVLVPTIAAGHASADAVARARELLERVGLGARLDHRPAELSGGEKQRVAIARAMIHRPSLLLADEPTGNLDRTTSDRVADLLFELQRDEGQILLVVTHSERLAARLGRRAELDDGVLTQQD